jgi:phospholipase D1/2
MMANPYSEHIFVFNLRSYDRLNTTPEIKEQEEKSGVKYQDIQREEAEEVMGSGINGKDKPSTPDSAESSQSDDSGKIKKEEEVDRERREAFKSDSGKSEPAKSEPGNSEPGPTGSATQKWEAERDGAGLNQDDGGELKTSTTIAGNAMLNTPNVSDEPWAQGHAELEKENFVQEELYIHAKLLIADDKTVICGSSNINDRSQIGNHDSELSIVLQDTKTMETTMDGKPYQAGVHAATLRRFLWREHLGLLPPQDLDGSDDPNAQPPGDGPNNYVEGEEYEFVADPLSDKVWEMWTSNATTNTEVFRELFHADPDDNSMHLPQDIV